jgi:hypothetical protein
MRSSVLEKVRSSHGPCQVFSDPMATGRVLRLNEEIGELQAVMAQVTGCGHVVYLVAWLPGFMLIIMLE